MLGNLSLFGFALFAVLGTEYVKVNTPSYTLEVPKGWSVSDETPWGARSVELEGKPGEMGIMTAGPTQVKWDDLYQVSLRFIMREGKGKPTPFRVGKVKQGYESCSWEVLDDSGFAARRYVMLKSKAGKVLALSIKIPSKKQEAEMMVHFKRMIETARFVEAKG